MGNQTSSPRPTNLFLENKMDCHHVATRVEDHQSNKASLDDDEEFYCNICMEPKHVFRGFYDVKGCTHVFCWDCIAQYVKAKLDDNVVKIKCPDPSCRWGFLEPEDCRPILPAKVFQRWGAALCESSVANDMKLYCPNKKCSALVLTDDKISKSVCPHCKKKFCAKCKVSWHKGLTCKIYQQLQDQKQKKDIMAMLELAKKKRWQICPQCGAFVERIDGCVFIKCRCRHCFCYLCASTMDPRDKTHFCSKCKCTFGSRTKIN